MRPNTTSLLVVTALALSACADGLRDADAGPGTTLATTPLTTTEPSLIEGQEIPARLAAVTGAWDTDFSKTTVDLDELLVGIPASDPRDAIPPIDDPVFEEAGTSEWLSEQEPGVLVEIDGDARFYPLSIMTRHEIVNDVVSGVPVAVTYCPLCNSALAFDRRLDGETLRLGVSGLLRNSDLVMWDDLTHSLWQQITGEGIVGEHAGETLTPIPSAIVRWADFRDLHPDGRVMGPEQGFGRRYGTNPYEFYSTRSRPYGFYTGPIDERFPALERVVAVSLPGVEKAYPFSSLANVGVVNDVLAGEPVVIMWGAPDTADALDSRVIAEARGIGTGVAYSRVVAGLELTFEAMGESRFTDVETGSTWTILGEAVDGELAGARLELLTHRNEFWFAWQAFFPDGQVWSG